MIGKAATFTGAVFGFAAMLAVILREGPPWLRVLGAVIICILLVVGALVNATAKDTIERVNAWLDEEEKRPRGFGTVTLVPDHEDDEEDDETDLH